MKNMPNMEFRRVPDYQPIQDMPSYTAPNTGGLGQFTTTENDKYTSIYDTWDFDTDSRLVGSPAKANNPFYNAANWAAKKVMQNVGTPFAVYERIPKTQQDEDYDVFGWPRKKKEKK